jgi:hypothetical protein
MRFAPVALVLFACGGAHEDKADATKVGAAVVDWKSGHTATEPRAADFTIAWKSAKSGVLEMKAHVEFGDVDKRAAATSVRFEVAKNEPQAKLELDQCSEDDPGAPNPFVVRCILKVDRSDYLGVSIRGDGQIEKDKHTSAGELFFRK